MTEFTSITQGPWRIRPSASGDDKAAISYRIGGNSEVIAVESHADLASLRDAISEYLNAVESTQ